MIKIIGDSVTELLYAKTILDLDLKSVNLSVQELKYLNELCNEKYDIDFSLSSGNELITNHYNMPIGEVLPTGTKRFIRIRNEFEEDTKKNKNKSKEKIKPKARIYTVEYPEAEGIQLTENGIKYKYSDKSTMGYGIEYRCPKCDKQLSHYKCEDKCDNCYTIFDWGLNEPFIKEIHEIYWI